MDTATKTFVYLTLIGVTVLMTLASLYPREYGVLAFFIAPFIAVTGVISFIVGIIIRIKEGKNQKESKNE